MVSLDRIRTGLESHQPERGDVGGEVRQAAVAAILREVGEHTEVLFILRATRPGDPWSGHMAFPGGHREPQDETLRHTAERETWEEIGLDLVRHASYLGEIDAVRPGMAGRRRNMIVVPFLYELHEADVELELNHEVDAVLWGSLNDMHRGESYHEARFPREGLHEPYPAYGVEGQVVWGLTYRMLDTLFRVADPDWLPHDD